MFFNHFLKKFCSGKADSSVFTENSDFSAVLNSGKYRVHESKTPSAELLALKKHIQGRISVGALRVLAEESAREADAAVLECRELDSDLDRVHKSIDALVTPSDASEMVKDEYRVRRNEMRRVRDEIRSRLEQAMDRSWLAERRSDEFKELVEIASGSTVNYRKLAESTENRTFSVAELTAFVDKVTSEEGLDSKKAPENHNSSLISNESKSFELSFPTSVLSGSKCISATAPAV